MSSRRERTKIAPDGAQRKTGIVDGGIMKTFSRRDMLKTSLLAPAAVAAVQGMGPIATAMDAPHDSAEPAFEPPLRDADGKAMKVAGRERLLMDFGWRFHFGHANDPAKDFGFGG